MAPEPQTDHTTGSFASCPRPVQPQLSQSAGHARRSPLHFRWLFDYDWPAVRRHVDRSRELNATSPLVRLRYAMGPLLVEGRLEEAIAEMQAALESDPLSVLMQAWLATMFWLDRQYDRAVEQGRLMVEIEPANYVAHWSRGMYTRERGL